MNSENETIVSGEMMKRMREAGMCAGYLAVPQDMEKEAGAALGNRDIADMPTAFKERLEAAQLKLDAAAETMIQRAERERRERNRAKRMRRAGVPGY